MLDEEERGPDVDRDGAVELLVGHLVYAPGEVERRVVDENIEAWFRTEGGEFGVESGEEGFGVTGNSQFRSDHEGPAARARDALDRFLGRGVIAAVVDGDQGPVLGEALGDAPADAPAGSRHQRGLSLEVTHDLKAFLVPEVGMLRATT